ncbi:DUF4259 domain-containing protein [Neptuniibacter sp. QD48_55]|uniref:DUF4259 domain-containing protein n=1 Tax=Neptuniibacter sp. QD48_55 TaxID=3398212 RepID=UPI0039F58590
MGAWNEDNFGNDDALDWIYDLEKSKGTDVLLAPIKTILANAEYLESPECSEALAASEVIAAGLTNDTSLIPEEAKTWLEKKPSFFGKKPQLEKEHAALALASVQKIMDNSELKELWGETDEFPKWQEVQNRLITKLKNV